MKNANPSTFSVDQSALHGTTSFRLTHLLHSQTTNLFLDSYLVIASLVGYTLALVELGIAGLLLLRDVFQHGGKDGPVLPPV